MENHPIPQDVTGFQFKLIGNMTVKQFAYLATGIILAWIIYQLPINFLLKFPFCAFFAILGTGLAYYPISGRPMDVMIGNYIKAFFRPTEFVYGKIGGHIYFPSRTQLATAKNIKQYKNDTNRLPQDKLKAYLKALDAGQINKVDEKENNFLMSISNLATTIGTAGKNVVDYGLHPKKFSPQPTNPPVNKPDSGPTVNRSLADQPVYIQRINEEARKLSPDDALHLGQTHLSGDLIEATPPKESLKGKEPMPIQSAPAARPPTHEKDEPQVKQKSPQHQISLGQIKTAKATSKGHGRTAEMSSATNFPNLITGTTKDARGNALSNILIEVKDKDGNPVRAFKTNGVGRFASATPLTNGAYTVEFEDPKAQNRFEKITINITGNIVPPIEATSIDTREELRRSLFAHN